MERKFYPENFEKFLKGQADQFKLTPSKKVWHGIYNDLHPGRRWPSIAMSIIFIFTLVIIGHLNTNNGHNTPLYNLTSLRSSSLKKHVKISETTKRPESNNINNINNINTENNSVDNNTTDKTEIALTASQLADAKSIQPSSNTGSDLPGINESKSDNIVLKDKNENNTSDNIQTEVTGISYFNNVIESAPQFLSAKNEKESTTPNNIKKIAKEQPQANADGNHKPRRISNITWTYYLSPSLSYRHFSDEQMNNAVTHTAIIGYEGGSSMGFNISKKLQFTTGLQLNYSGYKIKANNVHPVVATLILNADVPGQYTTFSSISSYGNNTGAGVTKLKNYNFELSVPVGLQYIFAENDNFKFGAAATLQPSYSIVNSEHLLSNDQKNYLTDANLFRKWNMNTSFSPFISFSSNSLKWQIGPQVRYQLLSTYTNRYQVKEHLVDYGFRIGISKLK